MAQLKDTVVSGNLRVTDTVLTDSLKINGGTSGQFLKADGSVDTNTYALASAVPSAVTESTVSGWGFTKNAAPGTLITNATTAQTASSGEAMSGSITLHKIAKTGTYSDLIGKPTIPAAPGTLNTNNTTAQTASASEALSGTIKLHKVAKTGTYSDLIGTPTIPTESTVSGWGFTKNSGTITGITMNGSSKGTSGVVNLGTVLTAHQDISGKANLSGAAFTGAVTGTSSGNTAQFRNITISSSEPTSSQGSNGDIWIVV